MISTTQAADVGSSAPCIDQYPSKPDMEAAFQAIRSARVPQVPDVVFALRDELALAEPSLDRAAKLIAEDPVLTGQVLKTVNSPVFFCRTKISNVRHAVTMMGIGRLTNLVTAEAIARVLGAEAGRSRAVWDAIVEQAHLMTAIARSVDGVTVEEAYLVGIMQDVGCLIFADLLPDYGSEWVLSSVVAPQSLVDFERRMLGIDHRVVGFLLAGTWRLPDHLALSIYQHHAGELGQLEDPRVRALVAIAQLACYLQSIQHEMQDASEMLDYRESAAQELDLSEDDWAHLTALVHR